MKKRKSKRVAKGVRILKEEADRLRVESERLHISENEYMNRALRHFLTCENVDNGPLEMKQVCVAECGQCIKCGATVEVAEEAFYAKGVGLVCLACYAKVNKKAINMGVIRPHTLNEGE